MMQFLNKNLIPIAIIVAGALIAGAFVYINQESGGALSPQTAAEKAMAFINQSVQEDNVTASLIDVVEESGLYRVHLKIEETGTEYNSYITKDGKFLFASGFNLEEQESAASQGESVEQTASLETLKSFAQCLTDSEAKFYGASWCVYCNKQKEMFGEAASLLPYVECSDENKGMLPVCQEAGISSYPTWEFNGEKSSGLKSLEQLSESSGCPIQ